MYLYIKNKTKQNPKNKHKQNPQNKHKQANKYKQTNKKTTTKQLPQNPHGFLFNSEALKAVLITVMFPSLLSQLAGIISVSRDSALQVMGLVQ